MHTLHKAIVERIQKYLEAQERAEKLLPTQNMQQYIRRVHALRESVGSSDPYFVDFVPHMTPIERSAWGAIRYHGAPFLPQIPIGPYFADFADPKKKIVLECDGEAYHQDKDYDASRDAFMACNGWVVFRVTGRECNAPEIDWEDVWDLRHDGKEHEADRFVENWLLHSTDGVVAAIAHCFYGRMLEKYERSVGETLMRHCSTRSTFISGGSNA